MTSLLIIAALLSIQPPPAPPPPAAPLSLDQRCLRLMADLAEDEDPRIQSLGRTAAQYFLGRVDAAAPGFDPDAALNTQAPQGAERQALLRQCGEAMEAGGRAFRAIGQALAPLGRPAT